MEKSLILDLEWWNEHDAELESEVSIRPPFPSMRHVPYKTWELAFPAPANNSFTALCSSIMQAKRQHLGKKKLRTNFG
jgi:hypothetical protein